MRLLNVILVLATSASVALPLSGPPRGIRDDFGQGLYPEGFVDISASGPQTLEDGLSGGARNSRDVLAGKHGNGVDDDLIGGTGYNILTDEE